MVDDLFYFVFGITPGEIDNKGLEKAVSKAYLDLSRTIKYRFSTSDLEKKAKDEENKKAKIGFKITKDLFINNMKDAIISGIKTYPKNQVHDFPNELKVDSKYNEHSEFDGWHFNLTMELLEITEKYRIKGLFKDNCTFSCGQAQKWINMTLKYIRIMGILDEYGFNETDIHVPLDDYILAAMRKSVNEKICSSYDVNGLGIAVDEKVKWSLIDNYEEYYEYQSRIREKSDNPIEWESKAWIAEAIERANK